MRIDSAIALVNDLVYMPGWEFTATDHSARFEGTICVRIDYPTRNANRDQANDSYPQEIKPYATFPVIVRDMDNTRLYRAIANAIMRIWQHETREFLRVAPTMWAPFHPHNIDGMQRWIDTDGLDDFRLLLDLQFGIA